LERLAIDDGIREDPLKRRFAGWLGMVTHLGNGYAEQSRCNFKMLWVRQTSAHSPWTLAKPRMRN